MKTDAHLETSIILTAHGNQDAVCRTMNSIKNQTLFPREVLVIYNKNNLNISEKIQFLYESSHYPIFWEEAKNCSLGYERNRAAVSSQSEIIVFVEDDVILDSDCLENLVEIFNNDKWNEVGGVIGHDTNARILSPLLKKYWRWFFGVELAKPGCLLSSGRVTRYNEIPFFAGSIQVDYIAGCCTAWRRNVFKLYNYSEFSNLDSFGIDLEFSLRAAKNYRLLFVSSARFLKPYNFPSNKITYFLGYKEVIRDYYIWLQQRRFKSNWQNIQYWWYEVGLICENMFYCIQKRRIRALIKIILGRFLGYIAIIIGKIQLK